MAYSFGDGFDLYAAVADAVNGYWDTGNSVNNFGSFVVGRFTGSQALVLNTGTGSPSLTKSSGVNDAVHHLVVAFRQTATISGATLGAYLELLDGTTAQCSIVFRTDGAILLTSGGPTGTTLATYTNAVIVTNTWYAFEFEVSINNTTGVFNVRKNGNTSNDFSASSLNTRGGTANNYANKFTIGMNATVTAHNFDDLFWRSDASSVAWLGDIRCNTRYPASDVQAQFSHAPATFSLIPFTANNVVGQLAVNTPRYSGFVSQGSSVSSVTVTLATGYTGNLKCALFACTSAAPGGVNSIGAVLGSATAPIANPVAGANVFTFSPAVSIPYGTPFYIGVLTDTNSGTNTIGSAISAPYSQYAVSSTTSYASFPQASAATILSASANWNFLPTFTAANSLFVNELQQDTTTTYVYDSTVNDADFYNIGTIASVPVSTIAVTTRGYMQKSDAGSRTAAVQLRSGYSFTTAAWNPADLTNVTLSGSNLVATVGTGVGGVRSASSATSGKFYWECTYTTVNSNNLTVGIALASGSLTSPGAGTTAIGRTNGNIFINNSSTGSSISGGSPVAAASVICFAVDFTAQLIWIRQGAAGQWNGSGTANPATATGGLSIAAISTGALFANMSGASGDVVTANFGASAFTGVVPSGFTPGLGALTSGTTVASSALTLTTSGWQWAWRTDLVDPNTSAAWTAAAVNAVNVGPLVVS